MDNIAASLETHRFRIEPRDRKLLDNVKEGLEQVQKQYPQIKGVCFYGSRTKGRARPNSDLDIYTFYDGSEFKNPSVGETTESLETNRFRMKPMDVVLSNARQILWKSVYPGRYIYGAWLSSHDIDISQEATDDLLKQYIDDPNFRGGDHEQKQKIFSRFMLGIGDGLYRNRKYILDRLENIPRGEDIFNIIMWNLQDFERRREEGDYHRYPTSISDARKYFLTK